MKVHWSKICVGVLFLLVFAKNALAQQTLNASGQSVNVHGMTFDYSIGEMTLVHSASSPSLIITQGLLQPVYGGKGNTINSNADVIRVYPNPTTNEVFVDFTMPVDGFYTLQLYDALGKVLDKQNGAFTIGINKVRISLASFASGSYYLLLQLNNSGNEPSAYCYKIQKIN